MDKNRLEDTSSPQKQEEQHPRLQQMYENLLRIQSQLSRQKRSQKAEPLRILIVDSNRDFLTNVKNFLMLNQIAVETVVDVLSALTLFRNRKYDVLITGSELGGLDGRTVAKYVKNEIVPIPVISVSKSPEADKHFFDAVLEIPLQPEQLLHEILVLTGEKHNSDLPQ